MKLNQLTFLRFVAAIVVVIFHYGGKSWLARISPALRAGPVMVLFFFVLSGFIMVIAYGKGGRIEKGKYWFARFARIAPVYYLALILFLLALYGDGKNTNALSLTLHVSFLQAWFPRHVLSLNAPAWSLSVEMFFYFSFPFCLALLKKVSAWKAGLFVLAFWALTMIILFNLYYGQIHEPDKILHAIIFYFPISHLASFLLGVAGGLIYNNYLSRLQVVPMISASLVVFAFGIVWFMLHYHRQIKILARLNYSFGLLSPMFLFIILSLSVDRSFLSAVLSNKILVFLGELGYSIYILQRPLRSLYQQYLMPLLNLSVSQHFYLYLLLLIVLSALIYTGIEKPVRYNLRRIADHLLFKLPSQPLERI